MTYDRECYDLAVTFLSDEPSIDTGENRHTLAMLIQQAIEDFIEIAREKRDRGAS